MKTIIKFFFLVFLFQIVFLLLPRAFYLSTASNTYTSPFVFFEGDIYRVVSKKLGGEKENSYIGINRRDILLVNAKHKTSPWRFYSTVYLLELKHRLKILKGDRSDFIYKDESWFLKMVNSNTGDREAVIRLSDYYRYNGDYKKAEEILLSFLERYEDGEVLISLGFLSTSNGKLEDGVSYLQRAIRSDPKNPEAYIALGKVYRNQGKHLEAQMEFDKAKEVSPEDLNVYFYEGYNFLDQGLYDLAEASFEKMLSATNQAPALVGIADVHARKKNYAKAEELYLEAMKKDPTLEMPYLGLGYMYIEIGNYKMAKKVLKLALDLNTKSDSLSALGSLYQKMGETEKAIEFFGEALLLDKNYIEGYLNLARAYNEIKDFDSASYNAKKRASYQNNTEALIFLGEIYMNAGLIGEAREFWRKSGSWLGEKSLLENNLAEDPQKSLDMIAVASETSEEAARFLADYYLADGDTDKYRLFNGRIGHSVVDEFWKGVLQNETFDKVKVVGVLVNNETEKMRIEKFVSGSDLTDTNKRKVVFGR